MTAGPDASIADTATRLQRSARLLGRRLRGDAAGLSPARLGILAAIHRDEGVTAAEIATGLGIRQQSLTRLLADLEARRLIARRRDATDRRQSRLALTAAGKKLLEAEGARRRDALVRAMTETLTPAERTLLRRAAALIDRVAKALP